ncbi:hypothetical protein OTU49_013305, partial [Cherax quadricarinatus]
PAVYLHRSLRFQEPSCSRFPPTSQLLTHRMHSSVMVVVLMVLVMATVFTQAQDLKYPERQVSLTAVLSGKKSPGGVLVVTELAAQIMRVAQGPWSTSLDLPTKRNSGLINSLLGIPKVMNDAGRR